MAHLTQRHGGGTSILFFGRANCAPTDNIVEQMEQLGFNVTYILSDNRNDTLPQEVFNWEGDYILCFRSYFILPERLLEKAKVAAINFHPAPPEYRGSGPVNFALYNNETRYGVTAHLMSEKVDSGRILEVRRFPIQEHDTVASVLSITHNALKDLCLDFATGIADDDGFVSQKLAECSGTEWSGKVRLIKELDALQDIDPDITKTELARIIRATYVADYPPYISLHGHKFYLRPEK